MKRPKASDGNLVQLVREMEVATRLMEEFLHDLGWTQMGLVALDVVCAGARRLADRAEVLIKAVEEKKDNG